MLKNISRSKILVRPIEEFWLFFISPRSLHRMLYKSMVDEYLENIGKRCFQRYEARDGMRSLSMKELLSKLDAPGSFFGGKMFY